MTDARATQAAELMEQFAVRTGLTDQAAPRRYLWTDAFALCNFIALHRATENPRYEALANKLVERVHHVLAPHHDVEHPTAAGLRIGKRLPERGPNDYFDDELEWDRDGQYFHYLTKWMHALDQLARATNRPRLNLWARELAATAHRAFTYSTHGVRRMYWKMSIDLSRPLVSSMGHHDPLDGFVTTLVLQAHAQLPGPELDGALRDFSSMIERRALATADPLGIGGLLTDALRMTSLVRRGVPGADPELLDAIVTAAVDGLQQIDRQQDLRAPASYRLGFRELGLAIGLAAAEQIGDARLIPYLPLRSKIERFWLDANHRATSTWLEHADINDVMLATSLLPDGFLGTA
ncbi:MAG TPA: hypothetical protein VFV99_11510 [Kofleriaceae bacterium]|nr:hypothetical protein [Kofleriaceae bacterium]